MTNVASGKKIFAIAILACLCAALIAVPAYAFYHVHDEAVSDAADGKGAIEIFCVVDETATGGAVTSSLIFVPEGSNAAVCLDEAIMSSQDQNGLDAIHNYDVESLADRLAGSNYTVEVYGAGTQEPGTQTIYDTASKGGEDTSLERFDNVVITVQA